MGHRVSESAWLPLRTQFSGIVDRHGWVVVGLFASVKATP